MEGPKGNLACIAYLVSEKDVQEVVAYWPLKWHEPTMVDVGTKKDGESFVAQKQKESTQKAMRTLTEQNKKEVAKVAEKNARMEKECTAKEKAEQEQNDVKESRKSSSHHTDEQELLE